MSNGYRNGAFALGLVVGGGLVINLFLWSAYYANKPGKPPSQNPEHAQNNSDVAGSWDWFFTTFINPTDTIAQWAMAILSLAAVYLLRETLKASRKTLKATQEMAKETTRIGEAQTRAYLDFRFRSVAFNRLSDGKSVQLKFIADLKNSGNSPAIDTQVLFNIFQEDVTSPREYDLGRDESMTDIAATLSSERTLIKPLVIDYGSLEKRCARVRVVGEVRFKDVFGRAGVIDFDAYVDGNWRALDIALQNGGHGTLPNFTIRTIVNQMRKNEENK